MASVEITPLLHRTSERPPMEGRVQLDVATVITELAVGEALVSMPDEKDISGFVQRAFRLPPASQIGPVSPALRTQIIQSSPVYGRLGFSAVLSLKGR